MFFVADPSTVGFDLQQHPGESVDMARREVPEPWKTLMDQKGIRSIRHLSQESSVSAPAISRLMHREGRQEDDTIVRVAAALGLDLDKAYGLAGVDAPEAKPYTPPAEAHRLNERQRKAIDELIRATVAEIQEQKAGDGSERSATSMKQAEGNSAPNNVRNLRETPVYTDPPAESETAAKRTRNLGRSMKQAQDEDAERPDPDPNED